MGNKTADLLDELQLFSDFPYHELETISHFLNYVSAEEGQVLFREGDPGTHMLILVEGRMSIYKGGENGRHLLCYEGRGRVVGEMALLDHEPRSASCIAETACELMTLTHDGLAKLAATHPAVAYRFMFSLARLLSRRLRRTSGMLVEYMPG